MIRNHSSHIRRALTLLGFVATVTFGMAESPASAQSRNERQDARTCDSFGTPYGSPAYSDCML